MEMNLHEASVDLCAVSGAAAAPERPDRDLRRLLVLAPLSCHPSLQPPREPAAQRGTNALT